MKSAECYGAQWTQNKNCYVLRAPCYVNKMSKKLKIVSISSEVAPFSKTGGLGDVARSLPKAIKRLGHEIIVITPLYEQVVDRKEHKLKLVYENIEVYLNSKEKVTVNYWKGYLMPGLPVYFVECKKYVSTALSLRTLRD